MLHLKGVMPMNTFHLRFRFVLLAFFSISISFTMDCYVEGLHSIDVKTDDGNHEPVFAPINHNRSTDLQDYFPINNHPLLALNRLPLSSKFSELDENESMWGIYTDGLGAPTWEINNASNPSLDGNSLRCAITGGEPYSNVHCYRNLPAEPTSNLFRLSMSFYYQPSSTFNNEGGDSIIQGLEFTMNKWDQGIRYEWALQWDNVDQGAPKWRYWDPTHLTNQWVDVLGISSPVTGEEWHTLLLEGDIFDGKVHYRRFVFDQQEHELNIPLVEAASAIDEPKLAVAVQLDGNSTETPYDLFIDHVTLEAGISNTFSSTAANDGWVLETGEATNSGGVKNANGLLRVGDDIQNKQYRSILSFDTSSLPNNAVISKVTLKIKQESVAGTSPLKTHGSLLADMAKGFFGKNVLENTDFQIQGSPVPNIGSFAAVAGQPGWYQLVLSPANAKYVNLTGVTQFRLRFARDDDNDRKADFISFYGGKDATNPPQLIVEYTIP
jgi:hypothetical protein